MPLKPSILKGVESILGAKKVDKYICENEDYLIVEDSSGRVRISNKTIFNNFSPSHYVSGIVAAIKGHLDEKGVMIMDDICFNNADYSFAVGKYDTLLNNSNRAIAIISGLKFGIEDKSHSNFNKVVLLRNLLLDFFQENEDIANRIGRLVIAGNTIYAPEETDHVEKGSFLKQDLNNRVYRTLISNYNQADEYLNNLSHSICIDLMPGVDDNSSSVFPQKCVNKIMLPLASSNSSVNLVSNPYRFNIEGIDILGTSGQNIDNIRKCSSYTYPTDILEKTIEWGHIAPTAPDTLCTYPFSESDPLILKTMPNVYFAGNQKNYESRVINYNDCPMRLVSVPDFSETGVIVLLDPLSLEVMQYKFEIFN